ncbi:ParA family protein [Chryseobacterium carnipullorum]|uniref:ParA family protein n=1 Tax=Chryseobacterium carnipullorum TaxID=1124835 RepID=UPI001E38CCBB|nr:ParA family protein [Chryseobacterium carnipullorum]
MSKIILTAHQKGGVGKSTLSFNLAVNLKENAKVCIIDFDAQGSLYQIRELSEVPIFLGEKLKEVQNSDFDFIFIGYSSIFIQYITRTVQSCRCYYYSNKSRSIRSVSN